MLTPNHATGYYKHEQEDAFVDISVILNVIAIKLKCYAHHIEWTLQI
jgi:hypothetical protein